MCGANDGSFSTDATITATVSIQLFVLSLNLWDETKTIRDSYVMKHLSS